MNKRVLIIVTSTPLIDDTGHPTGTWADDIAIPYYALREARCLADFASPLGGPAPIDPRSLCEVEGALPPSVETITITSVERGLAISSVTFHRRDLERLENTRALDILPTTTISAADAHDPAQVRTAGLYPRFRWGLTPYAEASIFDPDNPLLAHFGENTLKGWLRAHPKVAEQRWSDVLSSQS